MKNRGFSILLVLLVVSLLAVAGYFGYAMLLKPSNQANGDEMLSITAPKPNYWPGEFWFVIAEEKDYFKDVGLNVNVYDHDLDYFLSLDLINDSTVDTANYPYFDLLFKNADDGDLVAVTTTDISVGIEGMVSSKEITKVTDLVDKSVGVSSGTITDYMLTEALSLYNLSRADVKTFESSAEEAESNLSSGKVDAAITWEPMLSEAAANTGGNIIFTTKDIIGINGGVIVFRRDFIKNNPEVVSRYVKAWSLATDYIKSNPQGAYAIIAKKFDVTEATVEADAQSDKILTLREADTRLSVSSGFDSLYGVFNKMAEYLIANGMADDSFDVSTMINSTFVKELTLK